MSLTYTTVPPDMSPSPPAATTKLMQPSPHQNNNNNSSNNSPPIVALSVQSPTPHSSPTNPTKIRTINSAAAVNSNASLEMESNNNNNYTTNSSSSTAPPHQQQHLPSISYQYPVPTRTGGHSNMQNAPSSSSDRIGQNLEDSQVAEEGTYQHWEYPSPPPSVVVSSSSQVMTNNKSLPTTVVSSSQYHEQPMLPRILSNGENFLQKEQANFTHGNNTATPQTQTHTIPNNATVVVRRSEEPEYHHHYHRESNHYYHHQHKQPTHPQHYHNNNNVASATQNNINPSAQTIKKNSTTITSSTNSSSSLLNLSPPVIRRNENKDFHHRSQPSSAERSNSSSNNNYYYQQPADNNLSSRTENNYNNQQITVGEATTGSTNMQHQPFVIHPSIQPSSGIPPFQQHQHQPSHHPFPSSVVGTNNYPTTAHNPSSQQHHHHQHHHSPHLQQQLPPTTTTTTNSSTNNNYLNPTTIQPSQSSYSSPNSNNQANPSNNNNNNTEPKLRVYNSTIKVPEGIFSYDNTTLTCEPHGFKPNDRRGAPQTTHSVYVSDVLVVSCDMVNMSNQVPGIFQNCSARLVHLMGKNPKKKRAIDDDDGAADSEDDDLEGDVGKKKKKKNNKKKDQDDSLDGDFVTDFSQAGMFESFELLSEQPCQENVLKGKIVSSLKVPRVRGRDCKTKTGQIQVVRFKGTEREHIIAVSDLFWIRSRTRTEMEVRKFKKQQPSNNNNSNNNNNNAQQQQQHHENTSLPPPPPAHHQPIVPSNPPPTTTTRDHFLNNNHPPHQHWSNTVQPNSPSTNDHAAGTTTTGTLPPKKRRNNSPGGNNTPNSSYRAPNPAASIVHSGGLPSHLYHQQSSYYPTTNNNISTSHNNLHQDDNKIPSHIPTNSHPFPPPRNEPTYEELRHRVQMLEDKLYRLESKLLRSGHLSPDQPPVVTHQQPTAHQHHPNNQVLDLSSPFLTGISTTVRHNPEPPKNSFTPFPIDVFRNDLIKDEKRENAGKNPSIPSVVPTDSSQPAIYNSKSPLPSYHFDSSDSFLKNSFSPSGLLNPTSSSSSESGKREHI